MAMTYDQYQNKRSWLIDTAETAADQKRLKAQLAKLDAMYKAQKAAAKATPKPATKIVPVKKTTAMGQSAKAHQKDLAKISGEVASAKEYNRQVSKATKLMKAGKDASLAYSGNKRLAVGAKAVKKTTASFKKSK